MSSRHQGSKIALVRSYLQVPQAAGQVKILIFLMKIEYFPIYVNNFCDAGQVLILRYFEAWTPPITASGDCDVVTSEDSANSDDVLEGSSLEIPQAEVSAAQDNDKYYDSESDSDYDSGLDEEMVFSKLLYRSM